MTSVENIEVVHDEVTRHSENKILSTSPTTSTTSGCHSGDDSFIDDKSVIPSTLIEDELKLALNKVCLHIDY